MVSVAGMALDIAFQLQDGSISQVILNGSDNPDLRMLLLRYTAHILFVTAFTMLMFLPKILLLQIANKCRSQMKTFTTLEAIMAVVI